MRACRLRAKRVGKGGEAWGLMGQGEMAVSVGALAQAVENTRLVNYADTGSSPTTGTNSVSESLVAQGF